MMGPLPEVSLGSEEALYNIGVVARMTGVTMATLRAWERRYDFPDADRTPGGHRLYSERDVLRLRWVKDRVDDGMQTSQAIQALRHQEQVGNLSLIEQVPLSHLDSHTGQAQYLQNYEKRLLDMLLDQDLSAADSLLSEAVAVTYPEEIILHVIRPVFVSLGAAWSAGKISVATEHLATNYLRQRLLMWMLGGPPPRSIPPIAMACAPEEWHEGSLLILGALLRRRRWPIAYLGQALPLADLGTFLREKKVSIVVLVAMSAETARSLVEWPKFIQQNDQRGNPIIGFGGKIFIDQHVWQSRVPGIYLGDTYQEGLANIEHLIT